MLKTNPTPESWCPVPGYEGYYEVSNLGQVRGLDRYGSDGRRVAGRVLKPAAHHRDRHRWVNLSRDGVARPHFVHRLVLEAFIGPCPEGQVACHWDDDPDNNSVDNLRWGTLKDNARDAIRNKKTKASTMTHCSRGHEFAGDNLANGDRRRCLACVRARAYLTSHALPLDALGVVADLFYDEIKASGPFSRKRRGREWFETIRSQRQTEGSVGAIRSSGSAYSEAS
ncbi:NUMOD4 motif-containing HNH endonuclease [Prescottella equi]|uniref:NUMOD4 motif-containing HNH endonuclease n=1 Tax=Rhodococcus hoagii TaxID=43767 RepID=UPI000A120D62|nr:NUMOD4 motif-containing HNH endonuclease [Prescottella equi]